MVVNGTRRVNMILDNDALGDAIKNCKMIMALGIDVYLVRLDGKDPSVLGFKKMTDLIRHAKMFDFDEMLAYKLEN